MEYCLQKTSQVGSFVSIFVVSKLSDFRQSAHRLGGEPQLHAAQTLGLNVYLECATGMSFGMTDVVASFGSSSSQLTGSAHKVYLNSYKNQSIILSYECQSSSASWRTKYQIESK